MNPIDIAFSHYGLKEIPGKVDEPTIVGFFKDVGHSWVKDDEMAWCAAMVGSCLERAGISSTRKLNARSYLSFGQDTDNPQWGDIAVFWRKSEDSAFGHVAFYLNHDDDYVYVIGGNQSNMVKVSAYPIERVLSFRDYDRGTKL